MAAPEPKTSTFRAIVQQWAVDGVGIMIAFVFFTLVAIIVLVATASTKAWWDTVIASLAMASQAFFGYVVYRLGREQYAFAQDIAHRQDGFARQTADRQHKIDLYPLRKVAVENLEIASRCLTLRDSMSFDHVEAFRLCYLEIKHLFSVKAEGIAFDLYQAVGRTQRQVVDNKRQFSMVGELIPMDPVIEHEIDNSIAECYDILTELQNILDEEIGMR